MIRKLSEAYPFWIYDITRSDIGHDKQRAKEIHRMYEYSPVCREGPQLSPGAGQFSVDITR